MFTRYANVDAEVLEIKGSPVRQVTASLERLSDYDNYRTDQGYMYVRIRAISSRVNKNHDGWPSVELAGTPEIFARHQASEGFTVEAADGSSKWGFATFVGKPIFVDHNNTNPRKARGVIVDSKFRVLDQRHSASDDYWTSSEVDKEHLPPSEVELLLEVDAKQYPKFAKAIVDGDLDGFSMGANVEYTKCSHCGNIAHDPAEFCSHVQMKGAHHDIKTADGKRVSKKSYENCYKCAFFEISGVFEPADETALAREVRASVQKEGDDMVSQEPDYTGMQSGNYLMPLEGIQAPPDPMRPNQDEVLRLAQEYEEKYQMSPMQAQSLAEEKVHGTGRVPKDGLNVEDYPKGWMHEDAMPKDAPGVLTDLHRQGPTNDPYLSSKTAQNPLPQEMLTRAPDEVDTLRDEQICPICGSDMDDETCKVCGYVQPPSEFDNPDLGEAKKVREEMKAGDEEQVDSPSPASPAAGPVGPSEPGGHEGPPPSKPPMTASTISDMRSWTPKLTPKQAAKINTIEYPIKPGASKPTSNEPSQETVLSDQTIPVTSAMKVAQRLMAQVQQNNQGSPMNRHAEAPDSEEPRNKGHHPGDDVRNPEVKVDVTGVGGVLEPSNEQASKADAQVDVLGVGGTGVEGVESDSSDTLPTAGERSDDAGFNKDKITESTPSKTYGDKDGEHSGVTDPVTSETPYWVDESKWSATRQAYEDGTLEGQDQQGDPAAKGGTAVKGVKPIAEEFGERVNLLEHTTSPENNSGPTTTWTGTDGNGVLKQQEPVDNHKQEWGGVPVPDVKLHTTGKARMINAMRLAESEVELGLLPRESKWNRIAQLSDADPVRVSERLATLDQVKTAGQKKLAQHRLATKLPRAFGQQTAANHDFERIASEKESAESVDDSILDSALFTR